LVKVEGLGSGNVLLFVLAGRIDGDFHRGLAAGDEVVGHQPVFQFLAADVGEQVAVDHKAGRELLAAELLHLGAEPGVFEDVLLFVRKVVFGEDGADAVAPAAGGFEISGDFHDS
jgi:hypothetical protein